MDESKLIADASWKEVQTQKYGYIRSPDCRQLLILENVSDSKNQTDRNPRIGNVYALFNESIQQVDACPWETFQDYHNEFWIIEKDLLKRIVFQVEEDLLVFPLKEIDQKVRKRIECALLLESFLQVSP